MKQVFCQPHSREVTPSQLLDDDIAVEKNFADMDGVIASNFIVLNAFIFTGILVFEETIRKLIFERSKVSLELEGIFFRGEAVRGERLVLLETTHC
jgi:hypothetical protein